MKASEEYPATASPFPDDERTYERMCAEIDRLRRPWSEEDCNNRLREIAAQSDSRHGFWPDIHPASGT